MAENLAELETRPADPERNDAPDLTRENDDLSQKVGESKDRKEQEGYSATLPRWPFVLVGLVVAIFAAVVLYVIFRPRPDVRTADAYVTVHYATIAPRISGQIATVPVDDNDVVKTGQVLATLDPHDSTRPHGAPLTARARRRGDRMSDTTMSGAFASIFV